MILELFSDYHSQVLAKRIRGVIFWTQFSEYMPFFYSTQTSLSHILSLPPSHPKTEVSEAISAPLPHAEGFFFFSFFNSGSDRMQHIYTQKTNRESMNEELCFT